MLKKIIREPMVHFILLGMSIFLLSKWQNPYEDNDENVIGVNRETLINFMQHKNKVFNRSGFEKLFDNLSDEELKEISDEYVRSESIYRMALAMNLDKNDYLVRQRLVRQLIQIIQDTVAEDQSVANEDVEAYYMKYKADYWVDPSISFAHVFYDFEKHREDEALNKAKEAVRLLNHRKVGADSAMKFGDRFIYQTFYSDKSPKFISSHFGKTMQSRIFELPENGDWQGPVKSDFGYHAIYIINKKEGYFPQLSEIKSIVAEDLMLTKRQQSVEKAIDWMVSHFQVNYAVSLGFSNADNS